MVSSIRWGYPEINSENVGAESRRQNGGGCPRQEVRASCILGHTCLGEGGVCRFWPEPSCETWEGGPGGPSLPSWNRLLETLTFPHSPSCHTTGRRGVTEAGLSSQQNLHLTGIKDLAWRVGEILSLGRHLGGGRVLKGPPWMPFSLLWRAGFCPIWKRGQSLHSPHPLRDLKLWGVCLCE